MAVNSKSHQSEVSVKLSTTTLQHATTYFDLVQPIRAVSRTQHSSLNGAKSSSPEHHTTPKTQDPGEFEELGLTGTIISATAHIPYVVGITKDGKFEIGPRPAKSVLQDTLSNLSASSTWHHTLVGWTGKVLPARSAEFGNSLSHDSAKSSYAGEGGHLSDVAIHDLGGSGFNDAFLQHLKDRSSAEKEISVSKERRRELETLLEHAFKDKIVPVWMGDWLDDKRDVLDLRDQDRWHLYAENQLLRGLNDALSGSSQSEEQPFADYRRMNESVADAIIKVYKPGDIIWVHDYHLMLLPEILRRRIPSAYIAYFHYTNWADKGTMSNISNFTTVATGTLGASVVGMSTDNVRQRAEEYLRHVLHLESFDEHIIRIHERSVQFLSVPLGIDVNAVRMSAFQDSKSEQSLSTVMDRYSNQRKIVLRARSYRPGVLASLLDGFDYFLSNYSDEAKNVVLFLVTAPGTQSQVANLMEDVLDTDIARRIISINSRFGKLVYQPVIQVDRTIPQNEYFALLRSADLGIVASDHGAANSMSMEFVVCQNDRKAPLLIAERSNGGIPNQQDIPSSPSQILAIANEIKNALSLDEQTKKQEHERLLGHFTSNNASKFIDGFITQVCASFTKFAPFKDVPDLAVETLSAEFSSADRRLLMFDYDGTLTPIVNDPDAALPTEILLTSLAKLASDGRNKVWIISGRSRVFLEKMFGNIQGLGLSAEHGSFIRRPGEITWNNLAASMDMGWKEEAGKVFQGLVDQVQGSWIERKEVAIVWHYRNAADHDICLARAIESKARLEGEKLKNWDVEVMLGKANVEVRPRFLNKGVTAAGLIDETFVNRYSGFVLCAGDDVTDEDMFRALLSSKLDKKGVFSCLVSKTVKPSLAYYRTPEPTGLVEAISTLSRS